MIQNISIKKINKSEMANMQENKPYSFIVTNHASKLLELPITSLRNGFNA